MIVMVLIAFSTGVGAQAVVMESTFTQAPATEFDEVLVMSKENYLDLQEMHGQPQANKAQGRLACPGNWRSGTACDCAIPYPRASSPTLQLYPVLPGGPAFPMPGFFKKQFKLLFLLTMYQESDDESKPA
jgi:hypothetical protein